MFAILGQVGADWDHYLEFTTAIVDGLKKYFKGTSEDIDDLFKDVSILLEKVSPSTLALKVCLFIGKCPAN